MKTSVSLNWVEGGFKEEFEGNWNFLDVNGETLNRLRWRRSVRRSVGLRWAGPVLSH